MLFTAGLVSLIYGLIRAGETSWSDAGVIACLAAGVALLARVRRDARAGSRTRCSTCRCCACRRSAGGAIAAFAMNGSLYAMLLYFVIYLQDVLGYSALGAGCGSPSFPRRSWSPR